MGSSTGALIQFISDLSNEHYDFLKPTDGLFQSQQVLTKAIYDEVQDFHPSTIIYTIPMSVVADKSIRKFENIVEYIDRSGVDGAALHLKINAYHADIARGDRQATKLPQPELVDLLMPLQWYLKQLDPDGKREFSEVKPLVLKRAYQFYDLIVKRTTEG